MLNEEIILAVIKASIASQSDENQNLIKECTKKLKKTIKQYGTNGYFAIALVGIECQIEEQEANNAHQEDKGEIEQRN